MCVCVCVTLLSRIIPQREITIIEVKISFTCNLHNLQIANQGSLQGLKYPPGPRITRKTQYLNLHLTGLGLLKTYLADMDIEKT